MLQRSIAFNTFISSGARVIGSALAFISFAFIARALGKEGFGNYSTAMAFGYTASALADLGLYAVLIREISKEGTDERKFVSHVFFLRLIVLLVLSGATFALGWAIPSYSSLLRLAIGFGIAAFAFSSLSQLLIAIFQKYFDLGKVALAEVVGRGAQLGFVYLAFKLNLGLFYFLTAAIIGSFFIFAVEFFFARKLVPFGLAFEPRFSRELFITALPIGLSLTFTLIYFRVDTILLSLLASQEDVGTYTIAYKVLEFIIFFPAVFAGIVMPLLSKYAFSDRGKFNDVFQKSFDVLVLSATPLVAAGFILAPRIVVLAGGEGFRDAAAPLRWLFIAIWFIFLGNLFGRAVIALEEQKKAVWIYFCGMVLNVVVNLLVIPRYTYMGAAVTTVLTEFFISGALFIFIIRKTKFFPRLRAGFASFSLLFLMVGFVYMLRSQPLFLVVLLAVVMYVVLLFLFKIIDRGKIVFLFQRQE